MAVTQLRGQNQTMIMEEIPAASDKDHGTLEHEGNLHGENFAEETKN